MRCENVILGANVIVIYVSMKTKSTTESQSTRKEEQTIQVTKGKEVTYVSRWINKMRVWTCKRSYQKYALVYQNTKQQEKLLSMH